MKVLIAIDDSPCSDAVLTEVSRWPWPSDTEVRVMTVDAPADPDILLGGPSHPVDEAGNVERAEAAKLLLAATIRLRQQLPGLHITSSLLEGTAQDVIVAEAERFGADVVVVGSRGHGPIQRFFLGSVSQHVAQNAPCSVLIVRPPDPANAKGNPQGE